MAEIIEYRFRSKFGSFRFGRDNELCTPGGIARFDPDRDAEYIAYLESQYGEGCLVPIGSEEDPEIASRERRIAELERAGSELEALRKRLREAEKRREGAEATADGAARRLAEVRSELDGLREAVEAEVGPAVEKVRDIAERLTKSGGAGINKEDASAALLEAIQPLVEG